MGRWYKICPAAAPNGCTTVRVLGSALMLITSPRGGGVNEAFAAARPASLLFDVDPTRVRAPHLILVRETPKDGGGGYTTNTCFLQVWSTSRGARFPRGTTATDRAISEAAKLPHQQRLSSPEFTSPHGTRGWA